MRAVIPEVPPDILAWRKRTGADMGDDLHTLGESMLQHKRGAFPFDLVMDANPLVAC